MSLSYMVVMGRTLHSSSVRPDGAYCLARTNAAKIMPGVQEGLEEPC